MEGKEQRFGIADTSLWTAVTTVTSCGAVNGGLRVADRARPGGAVRQPRLQRGGLRRGRHRPLLDAALRPPRRLHRRPDGRPHPGVPGQEDRGAGDQAGLARRPGDAAVRSCSPPAWPRRPRLGTRSIYAGINPQGFSETLYAYLSQANNNGSALAGYTGFIQPNAPGNVGAYGISFADLLGGAVMVGARFLPILFVLAVAGSLAGKKVSPAGPGDDAHRQPDLRLPPGRRRDPGRRPHLLPRHPARAGRPEPDHEVVLMRKDLTTSLIAIVVMTVFLGLRLPAGDHRHLPGASSPARPTAPS